MMKIFKIFIIKTNETKYDENFFNFHHNHFALELIWRE